MEASMERLHFVTSETDLEVDLLLVKKKIKTIKLALVLMFTSITFMAVFNIFIGTVLASSEATNGIGQKSNRTENNTIEAEIRTLNESNNEILQRIDGMSSNISELQFKLENTNEQFYLAQNKSCLDTMGGTRNNYLMLHPCHDEGGNQEWQFTVDDELRNRKSCLTFTNNTSSNTVEVIFVECNGSASQKLKFISGTLRSIEYGVCVQTEAEIVFTAKCNSTISSQKFVRKPFYK